MLTGSCFWKMHDFMQSLQMRWPVPGHIGLSMRTSASAAIESPSLCKTCISEIFSSSGQPSKTLASGRLRSVRRGPSFDEPQRRFDESEDGIVCALVRERRKVCARVPFGDALTRAFDLAHKRALALVVRRRALLLRRALLQQLLP